VEVASRQGSRPIGNSRFGPSCGSGIVFGRWMFGSSPRCRMNTRFGLSANTLWPAPHVHLSLPGRPEMGFGQFGTISYAPKMS
jgi:hypothetical protein